jgi:carbon monoxide dehydrogenase subunit G
MELEHSFTVPVPVERAWDVLLDVERVAPCMPGASLDSVTGDEIAGRIKVKVGPISMTYAGNAKFTERDKAAGVVTLEASGKETRGAGTASASVRSELTGDGDQTHVTVHTTLNVTGKPAQFGRGVMVEVGGKLIGIFADNLAAMLAAEPAEPAGPEAADAGETLEAAAADVVEADKEAAEALDAAAADIAEAEAEDEEAADLAAAEVEAGAASTETALPIDVLNLPVRTWNSLRREGIQTLGDLVRRTPDQLLALDNIGPASVAQITKRLDDHGLTLAGPGTGRAARHAASSRSTQDEAASGGDEQPVSYGNAAQRAASNGGAPATAAPREPVGWQPQGDAIDLLGVAGLPVLKRALPAAAGVLGLILVILGLRRRRSRRS